MARRSAQRSLTGRDPAEDADARDRASLGPSDSSDSGSDLVGISGQDPDDPWAPVDVVLRDDRPHPLLPADLPGATPTSDVGIDRVVDADAWRAPEQEPPLDAAEHDTADDEGVQLAFVIDAGGEDAPDIEDDIEDEELDEVTAAAARASMPRKPVPEPDPLPTPPGGGDPPDSPIDEQGDDEHDRHDGRPPPPSPA